MPLVQWPCRLARSQCSQRLETEDLFRHMHFGFSREAAGTARPAPSAVRAARALVLVLALAPWPAAGAYAQRVKPWVPPHADSVVHWAADAKLLFKGNTGDSIGGPNYRAYERVGNIGRRMLRALGRHHMIQALGLEAVLDSLGLDTDVEVDPDLPFFVLLLVRNPFRLEAKAVGFFYWYRGDDLRMQGAQFAGGTQPRSRVWWTGERDAPYSWGVVDFTRKDASMHFTLFRLAASGSFWKIVQYEDSGYKLGGTGNVAWLDVNGDQRMELVAWVPAEQDSLFEECSECPRLINELLFAEHPAGFRLQDTRLVPSPHSTFVAFIRLLAEGSRTQAGRLLRQPEWLEKAVAAGWAARGRGIWRVEQAGPGTAWPEWMIVRFRGPRGDRRYAVSFDLHRGRWVIRDWAERELAPGPGSAKTAPRVGR